MRKMTRGTIRVAYGSAAAVAMALVIPLGLGAQAQDEDKKIAGGGITVSGWQGKVDDRAAKQGMTTKDSKFASEGSGLRITTGPATTYWNPANTGKGDFTVKATFKEAKQTYNHPHPFGVFIGGSKLDSDQPNLLYCVAYRDGTFTVRQFAGGQPSQLVRKTPHAAVQKAESPDAAVTQDVALTVKGDSVECSINGQVVTTLKKADIVGPGKLESTDGIVGIRTSHNSDVVVTGFGVK
jgi:hypothetical protein